MTNPLVGVFALGNVCALALVAWFAIAGEWVGSIVFFALWLALMALWVDIRRMGG
jgi:mannose/fructose/N-acetylgalactosamine-specific phosphotransferase system component IID